MWPDFNFRDLQLSLGARNQFAGIYEAVRANGVPQGRSELLTIIVKHAYAPDKGTYLPVSDRVKLKGKLPDFSQEVAWAGHAFPVPLFHERAGHSGGIRHAGLRCRTRSATHRASHERWAHLRHHRVRPENGRGIRGDPGVDPPIGGEGLRPVAGRSCAATVQGLSRLLRGVQR